MKRNLNQTGGVAINIALLVVLIFGAAFIWERATQEQQREIDELTEIEYISPGGEFQVTFPVEWQIGPNSLEEEGVTLLELEGPRNGVVTQSFQDPDRDGGLTVQDFFSDERFQDIMNTAVGQDFALIQIEAVSSILFELPNNKEEWRDNLLEGATTASGLSYSEFVDFSVPGGDGYIYDVTAIENGNKIVLRSFYLLGEQAEIEAILFPATSAFAADAEEIIRTIEITTDAEAIDDLEPTVPAEEEN